MSSIDERIQAAWVRRGFPTHFAHEPRKSWQEQYCEDYTAKLAKIAAGDYCQYCKLLSPGDDHECLGMRFSRPMNRAGLRMPFEREVANFNRGSRGDSTGNSIETVEGYPI